MNTKDWYGPDFIKLFLDMRPEFDSISKMKTKKAYDAFNSAIDSFHEGEEVTIQRTEEEELKKTKRAEELFKLLTK